MDNQKDEQEIIDTEEALKFIGKKYLYVCESDDGQVKFFDTYVKFKQFMKKTNLVTDSEIHDFIVSLKKCRLVVEREYAYEPALFSLETKSAKYKKIVEGNITDYVLTR
jgi:phosphoenolpyruvate synthase/pyruvate phosphate dikinase